MSWTDERVELLKKMWTEGQSASQIAKELGGVTRNAVIGKVHRLGLSNRAGGPATAPAAPAKPVAAEKPTPKPAAVAMPIMMRAAMDIATASSVAAPPRSSASFLAAATAPGAQLR